MSSLSSVELTSTHLAISWISSLLYMLEITLAIYYFSRFTVKPSLKLLLYGILLADTVCMICVFASAWVLLIRTDTSQPYSSRNSLWTVSLSSVMLTILAVIEELFLINRCRKLSQPTIITAILLAMVFSHAILNMYSGLYVVTDANLDPDFKRFGTKGAAVSAALAATVDIFVPLALSWQLYKVTPLQISKRRSIRDMVINSISSGGCGGIMSIVLLILFWTRPDTFYILVNTMGRIYALTLLINLIVSKRSTSVATSDEVKVSTNTGFRFSFRSIPLPGYPSSVHDREKRLPPTPQEV